MQDSAKPVKDDKLLKRGQGPNQEGLDAHGVVQRPQNAVDDRISRIEGSVTALDPKLDLILGKMKATHENEVESDKDVVGDWTKDIGEVWSEVKSHGRPGDKTKKPKKTVKPRAASSSSSSDGLSAGSLEREGETKKFARKKFYPKDHTWGNASVEAM